jgi:putative membrane protein
MKFTFAVGTPAHQPLLCGQELFLRGVAMKGLLGLGKGLTLVFWWVVLLNLFMPMLKPFNALITLAGASVLMLHVLEVLFFNSRLRGRSHPWFDRLQILLVGIFHIQSIPAPQSQGAKHA